MPEQPFHYNSNDFAPSPLELHRDLYRKVQVIASSEQAAAIAAEVIPPRFLMLRRADQGQKPFRYDHFNIVLRISVSRGVASVEVVKATYQELQYLHNLTRDGAIQVVSSICAARIDSLIELYTGQTRSEIGANLMNLR